MSKFSNLYDIDGNLINKSPQHRFTIEEVEQLVDDLTKKVQDNPDNQVYKVYLNNAQKWLFKMYNEMSPEDVLKRINLVKDQVTEAKEAASEAEKEQLDKISEAMEQLKNEYDKEEAVVNPTIMDEYIEPIEETV